MDPTLRDVLARLDRVTGPLEQLRACFKEAVDVTAVSPSMALTAARKVLEFIVRDIYKRHTGNEAGTQPLENLLQRLNKDGCLPRLIAAYANAVRELGNVGTHVFENLTKEDVARSLSQLTVIVQWYFEHERPNGAEAAPAEIVAAPVVPTVAPAPETKRPHRRTLTLAIPVVLTLSVFLVLSAFLLPPVRAWLFPSANPPNGRPAPDLAAVPATPAAFKGYIDVIVYDPEDPQRQNVRLNTPDVLPLKPGDRFAVEAEMNPPAYLYILWIDADGKVNPIYPWKPGHWEERPAEEQPVGRLRRPEALDHWFTIKESAPGMDTLVLLTRDAPLPADMDLRAELGEVHSQTMQSPHATAWFENGALVKNEPGRKGDFDEQTLGDPVLAAQEQIRARLGRWFPYTRAVSFADRGK